MSSIANDASTWGRWRDWAANPEGITGDTLLDFINGDLFPALKGLEIAGKGGEKRAVVRGVFEDAYNYMKSGQLLRQVINKIQEIDFNDLSQRQHFGDIYEQILNDLQSAGNAGEYYTPRAVTAFMADRIDAKPLFLSRRSSNSAGSSPRSMSYWHFAIGWRPRELRVRRGAMGSQERVLPA